MPDPLEYVITGALLECSEGSVTGLFQTTLRTTKIGGLLAGNELDKLPIVNIPSFIICNKLTQQAGGHARSLRAGHHPVAGHLFGQGRGRQSPLVQVLYSVQCIAGQFYGCYVA